MSAICVMRRKVGMLAKLREHKPSSVLPAIKEYFTRIGSLDTAWLHWKIYQHNKWYIDAIVDTYDMLIQYSIYIYIYIDWIRCSSKIQTRTGPVCQVLTVVPYSLDHACLLCCANEAYKGNYTDSHWTIFTVFTILSFVIELQSYSRARVYHRSIDW